MPKTIIIHDIEILSIGFADVGGETQLAVAYRLMGDYGFSAQKSSHFLPVGVVKTKLDNFMAKLHTELREREGIE